MAVTTNIKNVIFPKEVSEYPAYLEITLKTLAGGDFVNSLKNELVNTVNSAITFAGDVAGVFGKSAVDFFSGALTGASIDPNTVNKTLDVLFKDQKVKEVNYFNGTPKLKFTTYIPADFESSIVSNWSESELFGGINSVLNNLDKIPFAGSLIGAAYNALKNNASAISHVAITPKMVKLYQPSFFDFDLNFEYNIDNPTDGQLFLATMRAFQESQRPTNRKNSEELYNFPAIFDIKILINSSKNENGKTVITTKDNTLNLWNHITSQKGYGLTKITVTPKSGQSSEMKFRNDGINGSYIVRMSFTSLRRMYNTENDNVTNAIDNIIDKNLK